MGAATRDLAGQRTYVDLSGVRRRVADSVFELTRSPELVAEAMIRFDRTPFPVHLPTPLPATPVDRSLTTAFVGDIRLIDNAAIEPVEFGRNHSSSRWDR